VDYLAVGLKDFFRVGNSGEISFTNSKLNDKHFCAKNLIGEYQLLKSKGGKAHAFTLNHMVIDILVPIFR